MADNLVVQMARLNITFNGENGDLPDLVPYDATDADIRQMAMESVRDGYVPGIDATPNANFANFVVERYPAKEDVPFNRIVLRPKSEFGAEDEDTGVKAIIFLQKCAGIDEPEERAKKAWAAFSDNEKNMTMLAYKAMGGAGETQ